MFYSERLLSREGPLARVWLAANMERKLSKNNILQSNIPKNVNTIVAKDQAPIALRLSGQLLLGVVRIYSRKARYLLEDCNEALLKLKMAFRSSNDVDIPANQTHAANPKSLLLVDQVTDMDLFLAPPDPFMLQSQPQLRGDLSAAQDPNYLIYSQQVLSGSIEEHTEDAVEALDNDIDLNFDDDLLEGTSLGIEMARDAPLERNASEEFGGSAKPLDDDVQLNFGDEDLIVEDTSLFQGALDRNDLDTPNSPSFPDLGAEGANRRQRDTLSPLSSIRSSAERELEKTVNGDQNATLFEPQEDEDETIHQAHKAKRRKVLHADADTEIHSNQIRAQQNDRSKILKAASFLPRDPMLLALMTMQKTGGFVSSILGEGRNIGWAPELRDLLSLEVVKRSGELKRKRKNEEDDGAVDINLDDNDETMAAINDSVSGIQDDIIELPEDAPAPPPLELDEEEALSPIPDNFDDTTAPFLHPADSGPISLGTKNAVHLLRERFGPAAAESEAERLKTSVLFQDMLPERNTTKADATRMFFEMLVLATKSAIKVEQPVDQLGGPLRFRAQRGLWGDWAEAEAGGEIAAAVEAAA
ncbi:uncharacterized protein BDZ99DRAFT_446398 [Mytilinidion resinicola]|uniref:Double-strand-break repair protein rad21 n=1 Tax=Mytilinidion resinicola TaxID=574789 RepID=A0A6A6YI20_9PEZI|nr:uncharacterized protein BDZ99DRAFT_446398 [Mytilinidion resinicola]KAF2807635.1 hypothetical protein BDZ99DRAFT_446398 [Mytilinidion resinicola]